MKKLSSILFLIPLFVNAQLRNNGGTGTVAPVFSTSPTLITPALGTPSAIVLTNATGFPTLNQNTTGSAATLTTTRTIWGQNFNGSANVSGNLQIGTANLTDANSNELLIFSSTASAVNELTFANGATGNNPKWTASGGDADVGVDWLVKGAGKFRFLASASGAAELRLFEDSDNGTNYGGLIAPSAITSNVTWTFPDASTTIPIVGQQITWSGMTAARTYTLPDAAATIARTDAAQTFTGAQTFSVVLTTNNAITASGNAATVPVTSSTSTVTNNSAATLTITMTTASAIDGQITTVRILDASAVAQTITWVNTENSSIAIPTTSNGSTTLPLTVKLMYNSATSKWRCIGYAGFNLYMLLLVLIFGAIATRIEKKIYA